MKRPEVLDLFCCSGGAGRGYDLAGLHPTGVDNVPRPRYPYRFFKADALEYLSDIIATGEVRRYVLIHASPPCQEACSLTVGTNRSKGWGGDHEQFIPRLRPLLVASGLPYVIEQPEGKAPIRRDLRLCMDMWPVDPPRVFRHRYFEVHGFAVPEPHHPSHKGPLAGVPAERRRVRGWRGRHGTTPGYYADGDYLGAYGDGGGKAEPAEMQHALGIGWTAERKELTEAIPPRYTQHIGAAFLAASLTQQGRLNARAAA